MIAMQADGLPYICLRRVAGNVPPPIQSVLGQVPNGKYVSVISVEDEFARVLWDDGEYSVDGWTYVKNLVCPSENVLLQRALGALTGGVDAPQAATS